MTSGRKIQKKLDDRLADYEAMMKGGKHESKVKARMESGGFKRPGSRKK